MPARRAGPTARLRHLPREHWRQIWSNNRRSAEQGVRRRTDVVGIFPDRAQLSDWSVPCSRSSTTMASGFPALPQCRAAEDSQVAAIEEKEVTPELAAAS